MILAAGSATAAASRHRRQHRRRRHHDRRHPLPPAASVHSVHRLRLLQQLLDLRHDRLPQIAEVHVARRRAQDVVAGLQTVDPIDAAIVGRGRAGLLQRFLAGAQHVAERAYLRAR